MTEAELKQIRQLDREIRLDDARIKRLKRIQVITAR